MRTVWSKKAVCATLVAFAALVWMPAAFADSAQYLGEDGQMYTQENAAPVQQGDTIWGTAGGETWYVANGTVTIENRVKVTGDVHLILANSAALTVNGGIEVGEGNSFTVYAQSTEESEMGSLTATARKKGDGAGIGGNNAPLGEDSRYTGAGGTAGSITIHGGKVTATGAEGSAGIGGGAGGEAAQTGGTIKITGGVVNATGGASAGYSTYSGAGIGGGELGTGGEVTITGGKVTATGGNNVYGSAGIGGGSNGAGGSIKISGGVVNATGSMTSIGPGAGIGGGYNGAGGSVMITGGKVTATGGKNSAGIGTGDSGTGGSFSVSGAGTVVWATSISDQTGKANGTWQGMVYEGSKGCVYGNVQLDWNFTNPANNILSVPAGGTLVIPAGVTFTNQGTMSIMGALNNAGALENTGLVYQAGTYTGAAATGGGVWVELKEARYLDREGTAKTHMALPVLANGFDWGMETEEMWYVAEGDVTVHGRITVTGNVHLILANGATFTVNGGIEVGEGNSFTVYAQSTEESEMGSLEAKAATDSDEAGIGGGQFGTGGEMTIIGGKVTATGAEYSAGIGGGMLGSGGKVTVYGGVVNATGGNYAAGIGAGGSDRRPGEYALGNGGVVTVYGGKVTAVGGNRAAGIGGGSADTGIGGTGTVTVYGGVVNATGGSTGRDMSGAGIGGGTGTVAVYGGTVTATGGTAAESAYYGGAGIGTGGFQESDIIELTVTLAGGQVTATGGAGTVACGAGIGIGGGNYGDVRFTLTISDGVVVATGGAGAEEGGAGTEKGGAGIGTGGESRAGSVNFTATLSGGQVTAQGGSGTSTGAGVDSSLIISPAAGWNIEAKAGENEAAAKALSGSPFAPGTQTDVTAQVQDKAYFATKAQKLPDKEKPAQNTGGTQKQNPKTGV